MRCRFAVTFVSQRFSDRRHGSPFSSFRPTPVTLVSLRLRVCKPFLERTSKRDWNFYRQSAEKMLWTRTEPEYQREIDGIVAGLSARGVKADRGDLLALKQ